MLVLLIEKSQTELCLEIARHQNQQILIIETGKVVSAQLLVDKGTIEETGDIGIVEKQHLIEIILGILPLLPAGYSKQPSSDASGHYPDDRNIFVARARESLKAFDWSLLKDSDSF